MRIAQLGAGMIPIPPPDYGAVEKHVWNLTQALSRRGHDVHIVNRVFGPASRDEYRFALWARREVARLAPDVVHAHTPGVANVLLALGPRAFVYTTHSRHWATREGIGERVGFALERRAVRRARAAIAVSELVARQIDRPVHVVPNGVDPDLYRPLPELRTGRRLVGLGEVAPHKRWHEAAAAARGAGAMLRVAGPIRDVAYARQVEEAGGGAVELLGPVPEPELARLLGESDAMVHPSVSESFGMAVVEGMSCGLPVVCSDLLAFLVRAGEHGLHVPTRAPEEARVAAIREAIEALLGDEARRARMGEAARALVLARYAWDRVAEAVERVYAEAAA